MRVVTLCVVAAVVVCVSPAPAWAQGDRPSQAAWFCHSQPDVSPVYVSSVWDKAEIQSLVTLDFKKYLTAKYGYTGNVMCGGARSGPDANAIAVEEKTKATQIAAWQKAGMKIVETGWNTSLPKAGPPDVHWSVCTAGINLGGRPGQTVPETYLSAPFDAGDTAIAAQKAAFEKFLRSKYGITAESLSLYCQGMVDETQALTSITTWTTRANATGKAIDTGWKLVSRLSDTRHNSRAGHPA